jgi:ubiquinone/menaquinone biosynthesis C-methylase UbiE
VTLSTDYVEPVTLQPLVTTVDDTGAPVLRAPSGRVYPIRRGIPVLLEPNTLSGQEHWQQRFYDRLAPVYDLGSRVHMMISRAARFWREEYLAEIELPSDGRLLEVGVGTGANFGRLNAAEKYGLDLSWGMLRQCRRNHPDARLCQGSADALPYATGAFDTVLHVGAFNSFASPAKALAEMIRVARPGTRLVLVDATPKFAERYRHIPFIKAVYRKRPAAHATAITALPSNVHEVREKPISEGLLYCLTFRKAFD